MYVVTDKMQLLFVVTNDVLHQILMVAHKNYSASKVSESDEAILVKAIKNEVNRWVTAKNIIRTLMFLLDDNFCRENISL